MPIRSILIWLVTIMTASSASSRGQDRPDFAKVPLPSGLLAPEAVTSVAARVALLEGPAFGGDGDLFFSDIFANKIYRMTPGGKLSVFRADSGRTNGNTFDSRGRLVSCEGSEQGPGGRRRIVRTDLETGRIEVLTDRYQGKRYNSPNDVVADERGRIWFTDPF
jgi:gluconolactonase